MAAIDGSGFVFERPPVQEISVALQVAEFGVMPSFGSDDLLGALHLDGDEPDGLTLATRFRGDDPDAGAGGWFTLFSLGTRRLIHDTNEGVANPAQEEIAQMLGAVVTRQVTREGDVCGDARLMVFLCDRDDTIAPEVRAALGFTD